MLSTPREPEKKAGGPLGGVFGFVSLAMAYLMAGYILYWGGDRPFAAGQALPMGLLVGLGVVMVFLLGLIPILRSRGGILAPPVGFLLFVAFLLFLGGNVRGAGDLHKAVTHGFLRNVGLAGKDMDFHHDPDFEPYEARLRVLEGESTGHSDLVLICPSLAKAVNSYSLLNTPYEDRGGDEDFPPGFYQEEAALARQMADRLQILYLDQAFWEAEGLGPEGLLEVQVDRSYMDGRYVRVITPHGRGWIHSQLLVQGSGS